MRLPDSSVGGVRRAVPDSERALPLGSSFRWPGTTINCPSLGDFVRGENSVPGLASPRENWSPSRTYWTGTFDSSDPTTKNSPAETAVRERVRVY